MLSSVTRQFKAEIEIETVILETEKQYIDVEVESCMSCECLK